MVTIVVFQIYLVILGLQKKVNRFQGLPITASMFGVKFAENLILN
jgi:hypothetical protein